MKRITTLAAAVAVSVFASGYAQADSCKAQSAEKKLAGAAQKSFLTKCEKDAKSACDAQAAEKSWRRLDGHNLLPKLILGVKFADGIEIKSQTQVAAA